METAQVVKVTPEMAKRWLATANVNNRTIRKAVVTRYARDMKHGKWYISPDAIAFDENGVLMNGQHRLSAVVEADTAVEMLVATDLKREASVGIDQGLKRSLKDNLKMTTGELPQAFITGKIPSAIRTIFFHEMNMTLSNSEIVYIYEAMKHEFDTLDRVLRGKRSGAPISKDFLAALAAAIISGENTEAIDNFMFTYCNYENSSDYNIQSALNWRGQIDDGKLHHRTMSGKSMYLGTQLAIYNYIHSDAKTVRIPSKPKYEVRDRLIAVAQGGAA